MTENTKKAYATYYACWEQFCDWLKTEINTISKDKILNFIAWCQHFTHVNSNLTFRAIRAEISFHEDSSVSFNRKQHAFVRRLLDA